MADSQSRDSRTEAATPKRREKAREQGQIARSADLSAAVLLLVGCMALLYLGPSAGATLHDAARAQIYNAARRDIGTSELPRLATHLMYFAISTVAAIIPLIMSAVIAISLLQSEFAITTTPLRPDVSRLSWTKGFGKLWSRRSVVRGTFALFKLVVLGTAAWLTLVKDAKEGWVFASLGVTVAHGWSACMRMGISMSLALLAIGVAEWGYQRWQHEIDLRMSLQEIKDERKDQEGDPQVRARIKKLQREAATQRMLLDVAKAAVVVRNPTHYAVALRYERETMTAPIVVAKGTDFLAQRIIAMAEKHGVPVLERRAFARALYAAVEIGAEIPPSLYRAMAEILAYIYRLRRAS